MTDLLLLTPPFVQPNAPYPATAYLTGWLRRQGFAVEQADLSAETLDRVFSTRFLEKLFGLYRGGGDDNTERIYALRKDYIETIESVMDFLRGRSPETAELICGPDFLPQAGRFAGAADAAEAFGSMGTQDCARFLSTLYLQDISDFIRDTVSSGFEIVRYDETLAVSVPSFGALAEKLASEPDPVEETMLELLKEKTERFEPRIVGITVPFPGNLPAALRCGQWLKLNRPEIRTVLGGGYPTTELRSITDKGIFGCFDYVVLDDGELPLQRILSDGPLVRTHTAEGWHEGEGNITHIQRGCPDFRGLPFDKYFSLCEVVNPMHRLWTDGRWNKLVLAHGCYWAKCAFCDTALDYIGRFDSAGGRQAADWMDEAALQTGSSGFHFVDEAAPPKLLKELSLELLRRGRKYTWWTNIRLEPAFTADLCRLMAAAGCIAVSGGLEAASDRLLALVNKGVTVEEAVATLRNFDRAGIMVHAYLMYGIPTQTMQETVDALETVRQMFRAELVGSAFWHRYAMTVHSPSGKNPETYKVKIKDEHPNSFANNEISFTEKRDYDIDAAGRALERSLAAYMAGMELDKPAHKWFGQRAPRTSVEETLVADLLIKPDASRLFDPEARCLWTGSESRQTEGGVMLCSRTGGKMLRLGEAESSFVVETCGRCGIGMPAVTFGSLSERWAECCEGSFLAFYHSKKWDVLRDYGMLQI